jgi:uncharacterized protein YndB with AHSA1/START domain
LTRLAHDDGATASTKGITMPDILHRVGIDAPPERVSECLTTIEGLRGWWVSNASGNAGAGGTIDFEFCRMRVLEVVPSRLVRWRCIDGPAEWIGTEVTFKLDWKENQTYVLFGHSGWAEPVEFMHHCSTKWATFLLSLRDLVEASAGRPAPRDLKIHVGD